MSAYDEIKNIADDPSQNGNIKKLIDVNEEVAKIGAKIEGATCILRSTDEKALLDELLILFNTLDAMNGILKHIKDPTFSRIFLVDPSSFLVGGHKSFFKQTGTERNLGEPSDISSEHAEQMKKMLFKTKEIADKIGNLKEMLDDPRYRTMTGQVWHSIKTGLSALLMAISSFIDTVLGRPKEEDDEPLRLRYTGNYNTTLFQEMTREVKAINHIKDEAATPKAS